ncbi:ABC transporter permease [Geobacter sp. SVR]|uniref:ABC transporter permease n=1 Tax=Geobacter sp. SVR TaxID=2495594 RepID=UPI00143EF58B|nr:ABC transporter permease subunit [Geobacter sp. SVR]BCS53798.1 membrane protein [Geobacter sp. SVR]GCF85693.1 membrane protein [Geobacter sp. SVR]
MIEVIKISLKGIFRDRIFHGIMALAVLFLFIPSAASLSMRQVTELSITLSLSLMSFIMLLLAVFLGATSIWRDIERRYTFSVLSLPISRSAYFVGRFCSIALFLLLTALILGCATFLVVTVASSIYPPTKPLSWYALATGVVFSSLKYILLIAVAMLLSTISTSFFLPVFGTLCAYLAGSITQQVYDFLQTPSAMKAISPFVKQAALFFYYLLPNLSAFDFKVNAIYSLPLNAGGLLVTVLYFAIYTAVLLAAGAILLGQRELK